MTSQDPEKHYRGTSIGLALIATLDELPAISPQLAEKVRLHFDREVLIALRSAQVHRKQMVFKARCYDYNFCDDRWRFKLKDVRVRTDSGRTIKADRVAVNAISTGLEEERRLMKSTLKKKKKKKGGEDAEDLASTAKGE